MQFYNWSMWSNTGVGILCWRFIYDAMVSGYMEVPPRWVVASVGRVTKGKVVSHGRVSKRWSCLRWQSGLQWSYFWAFTSQGRGIIFGSWGTLIIFSEVCNCLCSYTPRHQISTEMPKDKVSWLLCIGRLVSKHRHVMHIAHWVKLKMWTTDAVLQLINAV